MGQITWDKRQQQQQGLFYILFGTYKNYITASNSNTILININKIFYPKLYKYGGGEQQKRTTKRRR